MRRILLAVLLLVVGGERFEAQQTASPDYTHVIGRTGSIEWISHHPACNPFSMAYDPVSWDGRQGIHAPRIVIHAGWALVNTGIDWTLRRAHVPSWLRVTVVRAGLPVTPHAIQVGRSIASSGIARANLYDYAYDFNLKQSLLGISRGEMITRAVLDVPLSCFARP